MRTQTREKLFSILTSLTLLFQYVIGIFSYLPAPVYADPPPPSPSANLDQCRNGASDSHQDCTDDGPGGNPDTWVNGNAGSENSHYVEGESIPYRMVLNDLPTGVPITLTVGYDIRHSSKNAIDYLTYYDRTDVNVYPTNGVTGIIGGPGTFPIPAPSSAGSPVAGQPTASFNSLSVGERVMSIWNGSISGIAYASQGSLSVADAETTVSITLTATNPTVVLAWGGHIGSRLDWGFDGVTPRSAGGISGSPYHMRKTSWTLGNFGNTDHSLSAAAVIPPGNVIVEKQTLPDGSQQTFGFSGDIAGTIGDGQQITASLAPGTYSVTESATSQWNLTDLVCDDDNSTGNIGTRTATINVESFETVKCTFTNTLQEGNLIVVKHIVNDNGGTASAGDFTMSINGVTATGGNSFAGVESPGVNKAVTLGSYSVTESGGPGFYSAGYSTDCTGTIAAGETKTCTVTNDDQPGTLIVKKIVVADNGGLLEADDFSFSVNGVGSVSFEGDGQNDLTVNSGSYSVTEFSTSGWSTTYDNCTDLFISNGGSITCTITNDDIAPSLTLNKVLTNDNGGTENESAWTLTASGPTGFSGAGPSVSNGASFDVGTYDLSESGPSGYTASDWVCVGGTQNDGDTVTLGLGESATCTITNNDIAPSLTLYKSVNNGDGGNAFYLDWTLTATGPTPISGAGGANSDETFSAGTYILSESGPDGYIPSNWLCSNLDNDGTITIGLDEDVVCSITNDDVAPTLTLVKTIDNGDGGNAVVSDFPLFINGNPVTSGSANPLSANILYTVTETNLPGYTPSVWGGDCAVDGTITLNEGDNKTCTITNDDVAPTLTLVKTVENDNFGTKQVADFPLFINGNSVTSGVASTLSANVPYTATETNLYGYSPSVWGGDCAADGTITLNEGDNKTCTITNDDIQPLLTVTKIVFNNDGGTLQVFDFPLFVDSTSVTSGVQNGFNAGSYTISETNIFGYDAVISGDCFLDGSVTLGVGDTKSCTITNMDIAPTLKLVKVVDNGNGGNAVSGDWTLFAIAGEDESIIDSGDSTQFHPAIAGITYTLSESDDPGGYLASGWSCDGGSLEGDELVLGLDEDVTCTITNDDIAPTITLYKEVINNNGGEAGPNDFGLTVGGNSVESGVPVSVQANTPIALDEAGLSGYAFVSITGDEEREDDCPSVLGGTVTLDEGENLTCTITNDDIAPQLTVIKRVVNNGTPPGTKVAGDFTLSVAGTNPDPVGFPGNESGIVVTLDAGQYEVTEEPVAGYTAFYSDECSGTIGVGEEKTCTVTNNDQDVLGEETEDGEVLGEELPDTGIPMINLLFAALAFEVGLYLRRRSRRA